MADPRVACSDVAHPDDVVSGDHGALVQRQADETQCTDQAATSSSTPSPRNRTLSNLSEHTCHQTVFEKLQALARARKLKYDEPNAGTDNEHERRHDNDDDKDDDDEDDDDEDDDETYEISWDGGPLGLLFKANANGQPVIRRVNKKGAATGLQYARAGDVLLALNGVSVSATPFSDVIEQLRDPDFPVKLDFRPLQLRDLASAASAATTKWGLPRTGSSIHSRDATSAFCGSPVASNATIDLRSHRGGGYGDAPAYMPQVEERAMTTTDDPATVEYDVVWSEGPLGCELKQRNGLPAVKSVTGTGVTPSVAQIAAGDILVSINGLRAEEIGFKSTVTLMMRATKPVYLRFLRGGARQLTSGTSTDDDRLPCRGLQSHRTATREAEVHDAVLEANQYTVLWRDGPLGIQIRASSKGRVVVARLTGAGAMNVNDTVKPGDIFVRVAGVEVDALGIAGAFDVLKTVPKPVVLVFQRRGRNSTRSQQLRGRHFGLPAPASGPSLATVPSFRQLREKEAAAAAVDSGRSAADSGRTQSAGSIHSSGHGLEQPIRSGYQSLENYAASDDGTSQASYDCIDSPGSSASHHRFNVNGIASETRHALSSDPPPLFPSIESHGADDDDHSEKDVYSAEVRDESLSLTALAPPPCYLDIFTASGRPKDPDPLVPSSTRMDLESPGREYFGGQVELPPPFEAHSNAGPMPPPPLYPMAQMSPTEETSSLLGQPSRLQELRRQYIESERQRNLVQSGNLMTVSTYSDIDDSGLVVRRPRQDSLDAVSDRAPPPQLALPELWVRWTNGPLGITFKRKNGQIVVSRLTGSGYSPGLTQLRSGDWLVSFNNQSTRNLRLGETMELLKRSPRPVDMCFIVQ